MISILYKKLDKCLRILVGIRGTDFSQYSVTVNTGGIRCGHTLCLLLRGWNHKEGFLINSVLLLGYHFLGTSFFHIDEGVSIVVTTSFQYGSASLARRLRDGPYLITQVLCIALQADESFEGAPKFRASHSVHKEVHHAVAIVHDLGQANHQYEFVIGETFHAGDK